MFDIATAPLDELRAARDTITGRIRDLETAAIEELEGRAAQLGFQLIKPAPKKIKRKRRTREEIEAAQ